MRTYNSETARKLENTIIRVFIREALQRGHTLTVTTYGEDELTCSSQINKIVDALRATDYDRLRVHDGERYIGSVLLVWGNDPWEVISDYSVSIEDMVEPAMEKSREIETRYAYWTCETCHMDMLEDAVILNDIQY